MEPDPGARAGELRPSRPLLRIEGVGLRQGHFSLLQDISFAVSAGDRIALVGRSGSGKSLLFRLLNGLISPTAGHIWLREDKITHLAPQQLRRDVVWVSNPPRFLGRPLGEAIAYPLQLQSLPAAEIQSRRATALEQLEIPAAVLEKREQDLNSEQRWQMAIARAWVMQPLLLLLEPPSTPFPQTMQPRLDRLLSQLQDRGGAVVLGLSRPEQLRDWGDFSAWTQVLQLRQPSLTQHPLAGIAPETVIEQLRLALQQEPSSGFEDSQDWPDEPPLGEVPGKNLLDGL